MSRQGWLLLVVVAVVSTAALVARLARPPLHVDELTYMGAVLNAMESGAVLPQKFGRAFLNKPPLALWLMRLAFEAAGPGVTAARLPSALAGVAALVLVAAHALRRFGAAVAALAAGILLLVPGLLALHGTRAATPDALEILLVSGAIVALEEWRRARRPRALAAALLATAASAWVKSPFTLLVIVGWLLLSEPFARRAGAPTPRLVRTAGALVAAFAVSFGAWLAVLLREFRPAQLARTLLGSQYVQRVTGQLPSEDRHGAGYYLGVLGADFGLLWLVPLAALVALLVAPRLRVALSPTTFGTLAVWALLPAALASASASKLPWYGFLGYPGIALLVAWCAVTLATRLSPRLAWPAAALGALLSMAQARAAWAAPASPPTAAERLAALAREGRVVVTAAPGFRLPAQVSGTERADRFFLRAALWHRGGAPAAGATCGVVLTNEADEGALDRVVALVPAAPGQRNPVYARDACNGLIASRLATGDRR